MTPRAGRAALAGVLLLAFLVALPLQASSLRAAFDLLDDPGRMASLGWDRTVGAHLDPILIEGHLGCAVLGVLAAGLLLRGAAGSEGTALLVILVPLALATAAWCGWALTHPDVGLRRIPGLAGILGGLVCPFFAARIGVFAPGRTRHPREGVLLVLCVAVFLWTVVTVVRAVPIAMAV